MSELAIASSEADAHAAEAVKSHHAAMSGALRVRTEVLVDAAARSDTSAAENARRDLVDWCQRELIPHARAEEQAMYPAARATTEGRLLIDAMLDEHAMLADLLAEVAESADVVRAAASATALRVAFDSHLGKENDLVLPLLAAAPAVSLAALLDGMHELLGLAGPDSAAQVPEEAGCAGHSCSCGEAEEPGYPELDVRSVPHAIRHATVLGALESVRPGAGLELVAPHDPLPLLRQINQRWPNGFDVAYSERGPDAWRLRLTRTAA